SDLEIKWSSNLRKKIVPKDSIVNFTLDRNYLNINRVSDKTIKLALNYLESSQKSAVVKYLFDFAETHNIPFIRK
ncbi:MAG TPA: hypothetical protein PK910_06955, partial [Bacteroidales bacterium]|nr:hypothetical protein [Bacteroidales bacterium]